MNGLQKFALKTAGLSEKQIGLYKAWFATQKFGEAELADGTIIYFPGDDITAGTTIYADEAQTEVVAAAEWVLPNGDTLVTGEDGVVTDILVADAPEEVEEEEAATEEVVENAEVNLEELLQVMAAFDERLAAFEAANAELSKVNEDLSADLDVSKEELSKNKVLVTKLKKVTPATPNMAKKETPSKPFKKMSRFERLQASGEFSNPLKK